MGFRPPTPAPHAVGLETPLELTRLEDSFNAANWLDDRALRPARARARHRAAASLAVTPLPADAVRTALLAFAAEVLGSVAVELVTHPRGATQLVEDITAETGLSRAALGRDVLRGPALLLLPPRIAVDVQLGLLALFAPVRGLSLWTREAGGRLRRINHVGRRESASELRRLAQRLLTDDRVAQAAPPLIGAVVERWQQPVAALVGRAAEGQQQLCQALLEESLPVLAAVIERDDLLSRNSDAERSLVESGERRLTRLGLDLHDGPLQDLALLAEDLRLFRDQLSTKLQSGPDYVRVIGRVDDLEAQLVAVDADLRRASASLQSPFLLHQTFPVALRHIADDFEARTQVKPDLSMEGDLSAISESQQMALLAIAREALSNAREHAQATRVSITVTAGPKGTEARVTDNGRGFDVETTLVDAARGGHLGLAGISERVRLLGGHAQIDSRPGGPTVVMVKLPPWQPVDVARRAADGTPA